MEEEEVDALLTRYFLPAAYSLIFGVGLVGNAASLWVYVRSLRPWRSGGVVLVNLALADLLYVLSLPFLVHYYTNNHAWSFGDFMCRFVRFGFHFNLYGSVLLLTCLAVFRCVVVMKPLSAARLQQRLWGIVACSAVWVVAAVEITPMLTMFFLEDDNNSNNKRSCLDFASTISEVKAYWYVWLLTVLGFLLPLVVVILCYVATAIKLVKGPDASVSRRMRARRLTVLVLLVFLACFLPYHVLRLLRIETLRRNNTSCSVRRGVNAAYVLSRPLAGFNTFSNLALYTLSGNNFRRAFLSTFHPAGWLKKAKSLFQPCTISRAASEDNPTSNT